MSKIYDIRDRSYEYAKRIIHLLEDLPKDYVSQTLGKQLLRSATSVGANIIEAQASPSKKDFANFYNHSLKSANESKYWLRLMNDCGKSPKEATLVLLQETNELSNIIATILLKVRNKGKAL